jgi:hypothetical protein
MTVSGLVEDRNLLNNDYGCKEKLLIYQWLMVTLSPGVSVIYSPLERRSISAFLRHRGEQ